MTPDVKAKCESYARRIKNSNKRAYAMDIIANGGQSEGINERGLSYMAAQAVRIHLSIIISGGTE